MEDSRREVLQWSGAVVGRFLDGLMNSPPGVMSLIMLGGIKLHDSVIS